MTIDEEIQKYADKLAQEYFPDERNIWARENIEAQFVSAACMRMSKYIEQELIKKACEWLLHQEEMVGISFEDDFIERFKKAIEE